MNRLTGTQIPKSDFPKMVGKNVIYLRTIDIDYSGRGYYFPRMGTVTFANKRNIDFNDRHEYHDPSYIVEMVEATPENIKDNKM